VHGIVRCVFVLRVRDHIPVLVLVVTVVVIVVTVPRGACLALGQPGCLRFDGDERIILWGVLAVEVVVLGLGRGLVHLVLGAVVVGVLVHGALISASDATPVVRGQELVHGIVRCVFVLRVRNHIPVLVLVVTVVIVVITIPRGTCLALGLHHLQGPDLEILLQPHL